MKLTYRAGLAKLFSESPDAQRREHDGERQQREVKFGHSRVEVPLPFNMAPREIWPKCWIGLNCARGCSHFGMASTGVNAPDSGKSAQRVHKELS